MNFYEQELSRLVKECDAITNPAFVEGVCFGDLGGDHRIKLQFVTTRLSDDYNALQATVINHIDCKTDKLQFNFQDVWGHKAVSNTNFPEGIIPCIWENGADTDWYVYHPTDADIKQLADKVKAYICVFADRSIMPKTLHGKLENAKKKAVGNNTARKDGQINKPKKRDGRE